MQVALAVEVDRLRKERDFLGESYDKVCREYVECENLLIEEQQENDRLRAELAEAKRDAERYHWIKQCALFGITKRQDIVLTLPIYAANHIDELDAAIDAALAAKEE